MSRGLVFGPKHDDQIIGPGNLCLGQPVHFTGADIIDRTDHLGFSALHNLPSGRAFHEEFFDSHPYVFLDGIWYDISPLYLRVVGHGTTHSRLYVINQGGNVAFQGMSFAHDGMGYCRHCPALGVTQNNENRGMHMG